MAEPARPLAGRCIAVTRAADQAAGLVEELRRLGAEPIACPAIAIVPPESYAPLDAALRRCGDYDWAIFTSVNGVAAVTARLAVLGLDAAALRMMRIGAIGPATAAALAAAGLPAGFVPATYVAEAILAGIGPVAGRRILLPRADLARPALAAGLRAAGAQVDEITAYRTVPGPGLADLAARLRAGRVDALTFTSSSTVRYGLAGLAAAGLPPAALVAGPGRPAVVCIGPITAATAREAGLPVDAVAAEYTTDGLVAALLALFAGRAAAHP